MSPDFTFIRRIEDDEGNVVAHVRYVADDLETLTQSYANTRALQLAPEMAQALRLIHEVLTDHPEAGTGNSKVHYALMAAQGEELDLCKKTAQTLTHQALEAIEK